MTAISNTLREFILVGCSAADAHRYLVAHFATRNGVRPTVLLRAPLADLALDHPVNVSLADLPSRAGEFVMEVSWSADGGGPYPVFIGSLACLSGSGANARIELEGAYTIPGGIAGRAFDAAIGHRIAEAAAKSLLVALQRIVETAREGELSASAGSKPAAYPPTSE